MKKLIPVLALLASAVASSAYAACSTPTADAGSMFYNTGQNAVQFCDGTDWYNTGLVVSGATGVACTNPVGPEGSAFYNTTQNTIQFCNGDDWVNMGTMRFPSATGTVCAMPTGPEGSMFFNTTVNKMQFCNGDDWVNATYLVTSAALNVADVFSTTLYTGNGADQTVTTGIDLLNEDGLIWIKNRNGTFSNYFHDTKRDIQNQLVSNTTVAQSLNALSVKTASSTGFDLGWQSGWNHSGNTYASWTFREAPKFFDIVTYTGNGVAGREIAHDLGVEPGMIIVKSSSNAGLNWYVYHNGIGATKNGVLNGANTFSADSASWNDTEPTEAIFTLGTGGNVNLNGATYVAYLFAHDDSAGGIIQCGSSIGNKETLGWKPQWVIHKSTNFSENWSIYDTSRGIVGASAGSPTLAPNSSGAEVTSANKPQFHSDGLELGAITGTHIYCAIREE